MDTADALITKFWTEVDDAKRLLDYAIGGGWKFEDGKKVNYRVKDRIIEDIQKIVVKEEREKMPDYHDQAKFEKAYRDLSRILIPVTAETLKSTTTECGRRRWTSLWQSKLSDAVHWSRILIF